MDNLIKEIVPPMLKRALYRQYRKYKKKYLEVSTSLTFNYRPDDVVIVSYPKSGSTWLRFIIANLITPEEQTIDFSTIEDIVPGIPPYAVGKVDYEALPSPRIMRSHSLHNPRFPKVIYLLRDGRDVLVSYYYHFKKLSGFEGTMYDFLRSGRRKTKWNEHVDSWIFHNPSLTNMHIVRYEDMLCNTHREIEKVVSFVGLQKGAEQISGAIDKSNFDNMRRVEETKGLGYINAGDPGIRLVREGKSGGWEKELGEKEKDLIRRMYGSVLIKAGYEASYLW